MAWRRAHGPGLARHPRVVHANQFAPRVDANRLCDTARVDHFDLVAPLFQSCEDFR